MFKKRFIKVYVCVFTFMSCFPCNSSILISPEDVATGFSTIFGFAPPIYKVPTTPVYLSRLHYTMKAGDIAEYIRMKSNVTLRVQLLGSSQNASFKAFLVLVPTDKLATFMQEQYWLIGNDHRFGFGFRFGNHADLQILYEFGPQTVTKPLQQTTKVRSTSSRQRFVNRRPLLDLLLRAGILKKASYDDNVINEFDSEPR